MAAAKKALSVVGAVAVIGLAGGGERYLYRGAVVDPEQFDADSVKHVTDLGLVAEVEVVKETAAAAGAEPDFPEGDPSEEWAGKQLDAYAKAKDVDISKAKNKTEKVAALAAAAEKAAADAAGGSGDSA